MRVRRPEPASYCLVLAPLSRPEPVRAALQLNWPNWLNLRTWRSARRAPLLLPCAALAALSLMLALGSALPR
jgi:hypothetical protein